MKKGIAFIVVIAAAAAGAWYFLKDPLQAAAQKRTVADMRNIGTGWMNWLTDQVGQNDLLHDPLRPEEIEIERLVSALPIILLAQLPSPDGRPTVKIGYSKDGKGNPTEFLKLTYEELLAQLHPSDTFFYMQDIPKTDGWGNEFEFYVNSNLLASNVLLIRSPGRDGKYSGNSYKVGPFEKNAYDEDVVWADGYFVRYPEQVKTP